MKHKFYGWYFKCCSNSKTLAMIPAVHGDECSIQVITDQGSWNVSYPASMYEKSGTVIDIAGNRFGKQGILLELHSPDLHAVGALSFRDLTPLRYDIMGPFRYVPFMECRHSVLSMRHFVTGEVTVNGVLYQFNNDMGYWEGDCGTSFPKEYAWTQCLFPEGSLMLSVADIPLCGFHFTGIIGVVLWKGVEYRLATYLGAEAKLIRNGEIVIEQGSRQLRVRLGEKTAHPLRAPQVGAMERIIHESASCKVFYEFRERGEILFSFEACDASFEYEYNC